MVQAWYGGCITAYDATGYRIEFDDGDKEWEDLSSDASEAQPRFPLYRLHGIRVEPCSGLRQNRLLPQQLHRAPLERHSCLRLHQRHCHRHRRRHRVDQQPLCSNHVAPQFQQQRDISEGTQSAIRQPILRTKRHRNRLPMAVGIAAVVGPHGRSTACTPAACCLRRHLHRLHSLHSLHELRCVTAKMRCSSRRQHCW